MYKIICFGGFVITSPHVVSLTVLSKINIVRL